MLFQPGLTNRLVMDSNRKEDPAQREIQGGSLVSADAKLKATRNRSANNEM